MQSREPDIASFYQRLQGSALRIFLIRQDRSLSLLPLQPAATLCAYLTCRAQHLLVRTVREQRALACLIFELLRIDSVLIRDLEPQQFMNRF